MAKRTTTEDQLAELRRLRSAGPSDVPVGLEKLLGQSKLHGIIVKGAAAMAEQAAAKNVAVLLANHVRELMREPGRDPGCEGKEAALKALVGWDADMPELFVEAAGYHQKQGVMGGFKDTAAEFRGLAALGVAATRPEGAIGLLVDLLVDEEHATRARAALALGRWRGPEAAPVLRLKARMGDDDAEVIGEVLASLLQIDAGANLAFVAGFLHSDSHAVIEGAALALGQSKPPGALGALAEAWPGLRGSPAATTVLMAVSLLRTPEAVDWLLARLAEARTKEGLALLDAMALFRADARTVERIEKIAAKRPEFKTVFDEIFRGR